MGISELALAIFPTVFTALVVAWLFATPEQLVHTAERIRKLRSLSYKVIVIFMGSIAVLRCGYAFVEFAKSDLPISRIDIVELFAYFLNFLVALIATTVFATIWRHTALNKNPAEAGLGDRPRDAG